MGRDIDTTKHLIELIKTTVGKIVGKTTGREFKFIFDMVFGMMKKSSVVLSDIAHGLSEEASIKTIVDRLYNNLLRIRDTTENHALINVALKLMGEEKVFAVDNSDVQKPYGVHFEALMKVRDGSSINNDTYNLGYVISSIVGMSKDYKHPICLYDHVHNSNEGNFLSENHITHIGLNMVIEHLKDYEGIFIFDRGYDDQKLLKLLLTKKQYFVVRMQNNRWISYKNKKIKAFDLADKRKGKIVVPLTYKGKETYVKASHVIAKINGIKTPLTIVFSYLETSNKPMILMTNKIIKSKEDLIKVVLHYHSRWKIEEHFRFKKVQYNIENFRVKALESINSLFFIVDVLILILVIIIERQNTNLLYKEIMNHAKVTREDTYIQFYKLASGIIDLLGANKTGVKHYQNIRKEKLDYVPLFKIRDFD